MEKGEVISRWEPPTSLLLPCPHPARGPADTGSLPVPTLLPLRDALWGLGQFAYILIYKKLSTQADSDAWAAF